MSKKFNFFEKNNHPRNVKCNYYGVLIQILQSAKLTANKFLKKTNQKLFSIQSLLNKWIHRQFHAKPALKAQQKNVLKATKDLKSETHESFAAEKVKCNICESLYDTTNPLEHFRCKFCKSKQEKNSLFVKELLEILEYKTKQKSIKASELSVKRHQITCFVIFVQFISIA